MLRQRITTALVMAGALLAVLFWLPPLAAVWLFALVLLLGAWEWSTFVGLGKTPGRVAYVLALAMGMLLAWVMVANRQGLSALMLASAGWWLVALLWIVLSPAKVSATLAAIAGACSLIPAWVALAHIHLGLDRGPQWVLFLFLMIAMADIGAFLTGRKLGHTKLAPRVSPGKTWEGVAGGVVFALAVAWLGALWFELPMRIFIGLCAVVVLGSIVGDLNESLFKRHVGLKDSSTLLPGHGGVLDRIDSMTAAAPLFLLALMWLGIFK